MTIPRNFPPWMKNWLFWKPFSLCPGIRCLRHGWPNTWDAGMPGSFNPWWTRWKRAWRVPSGGSPCSVPAGGCNWSPAPHSRLTIASLETLSIVAYRQPVTIAEISEMRGVNSVGPVKNLLQKKLIRITGRKKVPGRPLLYASTREFLLYFGLNDLSELPSLEELTEMFEEKEQPSLFTESL